MKSKEILEAAHEVRPLGARDNRTDEQLAKTVDDSARQIQRYIRLTELIPELLDMVDEGKIAFRPAVELSYLPEPHQNLLVEAIDYAQESPSLAQARRIRAFSASGKLDSNGLDAILSEEKPLETKVTLKGDKLKQYFPSGYTPRQMEQVITKLLEEWSRRQWEGVDRGR